MDFSITAATNSGGGVRVASYGSGNEGGRLAAVSGRARNQSASPARVRAAKSAVNRSSASRAAKRRALAEIDLQAHPRSGRTRTGSLQAVMDAFNNR